MKHICSLIFTCLSLYCFGQRTLGLIDYQIPNTGGYVLFAPITSTNTYLIDKCGEKIHQWPSTYRPGLSVYLLPDGKLLRTGVTNNTVFTAGGNGGAIEKYDWSGNLLWSYVVSDSNQCQHHDVAALPNGNILAVVWDRRTNADAIANGKNPAQANPYIWSEKIVELQPVGTNNANIVWEWKLWDHLVQEFDNSKLNFNTVSQHPELINLNYFTGAQTNQDWIHINSIDYNSSLDQILISSHNLCEVYVIDHSTSTAQAGSHTGGNSGKGGDILYRWGNPIAYNRGTVADKKLFGQHHATWIPSGYPNAGKILVFNNGLNRPAGNYSSVDMIETPIDISNQYPIGVSTAFLPTNLFWTYTDPVPTNFFSNNISGVYPLQNGSYMIANGQKGTFFEINNAQQTVWKYISPVNSTGALSQGSNPTGNTVFRCNFYEPTYAGLASQSLIPQGEIELNPLLPSICDSLQVGITEATIFNSISVYPNPSSDYLAFSIKATPQNNVSATLITPLGQKIKTIENIQPGVKYYLDISGLAIGIYYLKLETIGASSVQKILIAR